MLSLIEFDLVLSSFSGLWIFLVGLLGWLSGILEKIWEGVSGKFSLLLLNFSSSEFD